MSEKVENTQPNIVTSFNESEFYNNKIQSESEILGIFKTKRETLKKLESEISISHPYEIPEFIVLAPEGVSSKYLEWIDKSTNSV